MMTRDPEARRNGYSANSYITALEEGLLEQYRPGQPYLQDNSRIHTSKKVGEWLVENDILAISFPPYSPDLNPIEHMWWALKKKLHERNPELDYMGTSAEEWDTFEHALIDAWFAIPDSLIKSLITSMPRRLDADIAAKGFQTKY